MNLRNLHLFNPENDLALAIGCRQYTPPPHAAALHRAGALLPAWWAEDGDMVIAPDGYDDDTLWLKSRWGIECAITPARSSELPAMSPQPWGWSEDARRQFIMAGMAENMIPSSDAISGMRPLSHRRTSIIILKELGEDLPLPQDVSDPDRVLSLESQSPGRYIKSPWSCSGRGVFCAEGIPSDTLRSKAEGIIRRQGCVIVEQGFDKTVDFASLFYSDGNNVSFRGLSLFYAEQRGVYTGNIVAPQDYIHDRLSETYSPSGDAFSARLSSCTSHLGHILTRLIAPHYRGWLGIDMMIYRDRQSGSLRIHPCIELNLRRTMGVAAMHIASRLGVSSPKLLTWQHTPPEGSTLLAQTESTPILPPRDNFVLTLTPLKHT